MAIIDLPDRSKEGLKNGHIRLNLVTFNRLKSDIAALSHFSTQNQKKSMSLMWLSCNQSALTMILNVKMLSKSLLLKMKVRTVSLL